MGAQLLCVVLLVGLATGATASQGAQVTPTVVMPSMAGRDIYQYFCAACHGRDGRGAGPIAPELKKAPANLTMLAANNRGQFPADRVRAFVTQGRADAPAHGSPDMPVWGPIFRSLDPSDKLADMRVTNVVEYIRSIQSK
jgi:mono/diheme cytochrome c family protein